MADAAVAPFPLEQLRIATPCQQRWEDMEGDEARRFCAACGLYVHNLAAMTREQADTLLAAGQRSGARTCVRLYRRADGTVITRDCPVGLAAARRRVWAGVRRAAAAIFLAGASLVSWKRAQGVLTPGSGVQARGLLPFSWISERLGRSAPPPGTSMVMGDVCFPAPPTLTQHVKELSGVQKE